MDSKKNVIVALNDFRDVLVLKKWYEENHCIERLELIITTRIAPRLLYLAIRFGFWVLQTNGELVLRDIQGLSRDYGMSGGKLTYSKFAVAIRLFLSTERQAILTHRWEELEFRVFKAERQTMPGLTIGIVWSGRGDERVDLESCLAAIIECNRHTKCEVIVACPKSKKYDLPGVDRWLPYEDEIGSIRIGEKKNLIYKCARYDCIAILHTRIRLSSSFFSNLPHEFDVFTPKIHARYADKEMSYFDLVFLRSADLFLHMRSPFGRFHLSRFYPEHQSYLKIISRYQFYIDGGCIVLNRKKLGSGPIWHPDIEWGEAEDVWLSRKLDLFGFVQDRIETMTATSNTNKSISLSGSGVGAKVKRLWHKLTWSL